ncbi:hypothetical protein A2U01_0051841, partial [Trifolium medium]|nr:hypothetical protein [Trifolium medium]
IEEQPVKVRQEVSTRVFGLPGDYFQVLIPIGNSFTGLEYFETEDFRHGIEGTENGGSRNENGETGQDENGESDKKGQEEETGEDEDEETDKKGQEEETVVFVVKTV